MHHLLEDPHFKQLVKSFALDHELELDQVQKEASIYLEELHTQRDEIYTGLAMEGFRFAISRGYDKTFDVNPEELKKLGKLMRKHSVAFVLTHKTYIDTIVLSLALQRHGLPIPCAFAGINLNFFGAGQLGRKTGIIFIRRATKENPLYREILKSYIAYLVKQKEHFMWAIEGTRSRTGKLVWPMMGILKYIADGEEAAQQEVKYVPVSITYDLIPDVQEMTKEIRGKSKNPENLKWMLQYLRDLNQNYGRISIRIGDPLERSEGFKATIPNVKEREQEQKKYVLPKMAFELVHKINKITPITTTSLICTCLLSKFALNKPNLEAYVSSLMSVIESHQADVLVDRGKPIGESVQKGILLLKQAGLLRQLGEGTKAKFSIVIDNFLASVYYSNMSVHHFYHRAFIELALVESIKFPKEERILIFWKEIMSLRNLFKFEFFFSGRSIFTEEVERELDQMFPNWKDELLKETPKLPEHIIKGKLILSQVVLSTYLQAYTVVARTLLQWEVLDEVDENDLLHHCLFLGEELQWQGSIHRIESVSKPFLKNGIRLAMNSGLVPTKEDSKSSEIHAFLDKLQDFSRRIRKMQVASLEHNKEQVQIEVPLERSVVPGSKTSGIVEPIIAGKSGKEIVAFFDLDRTLIKGFSAKEFVKARLLSGKMTQKELMAQLNGAMIYAIGNKNFAGLAAISSKGVKGIKEEVFIEMGEDVYLKHLAELIYPESRALVAAHLAKGHRVAIVSAATPYQVNPVARDLGIEDVMCTRLEVKAGKFTGNVVEPACWGEGKAIAAKQYAEQHGLDLEKAYFYTDSAEDMPLMQIVGHPRPINPDKELSNIAYQNDWPIFRFDDEQPSQLSGLARTGLAMASLGPILLNSIVNGGWSLSSKDGKNSLISTFGDFFTSAAGIQLVVKGEEILKNRPAVFIPNHQSNVDPAIIAKLLRHDIVGIAKKEVKSMPIIGQMMAAGGTIFIDRKDKKKAVEAMQPAVDALKSGTSIVIFPEGTRSKDYKLGAFKKGAFHLAMQAGVPLIPIVIRNAHDVMPKGSSLLNPSFVEVTVLDPISTKNWELDVLNDKIEDIRNLFLTELGQA